MKRALLVVLLLGCAHRHPPVPEVVLSPAWTLPDVDIQPTSWSKVPSKYRAYFNSIKEQVRKHWDAAQSFHDLDPDAKKFGTNDRDTHLQVTLTPDGRVRHIVVDRSSEITQLDEVAVAAFEAAAPFPAPPRELLKDDLMTFNFGFRLQLHR